MYFIMNLDASVLPDPDSPDMRTHVSLPCKKKYDHKHTYVKLSTLAMCLYVVLTENNLKFVKLNTTYNIHT